VPKMSGGVVRGVTPLKIEIFFFFPQSLYLVKTKVASAKNVWRGVRGVTPPQNHSKKYFCLPQSRVK